MQKHFVFAFIYLFWLSELVKKTLKGVASSEFRS
jgi:hypothetical protein